MNEEARDDHPPGAEPSGPPQRDPGADVQARRARRYSLLTPSDTAARLLLPRILVFGLFYWAFVTLGARLSAGSLEASHAVGLLAAIAATVLTRWLSLDRGGIGLAFPPRRIAAQAVSGLILALLIIGGGDVAVDATSRLDHGFGGEFPWASVLLFYLPAAAHEELLFRGYVFQRVASWSRPVAVVALPLLFAAAHLGNPGVSGMALVNIALAGVLLSLAYLRFESLWLPISLHFFWNVLVGPVLGYRVSGIAAPESVLTAPLTGPVLLTGGSFGIEASAWITAMEAAVILFLFYRLRSQNRPDAVLAV